MQSQLFKQVNKLAGAQQNMNHMLESGQNLLAEIEKQMERLAPNMPYEKIWGDIMPGYLIEKIIQIDEIMTDPVIFANTLLILNQQMQELNVEDPQMALCMALTENEKLNGQFAEPVLISEVATVQEFQDMLQNGGVFDDTGVSYMHGRRSHRIQRMMLSLTLGKSETTDLFKELSKSEYVRPNPNLGLPYDDREQYTFFDDLFDRLPCYRIVNDKRLPLNELFQAIRDGTEELLKIPQSYYNLHDPRIGEWIPSFVRACTDPSISLLRKAYLQERGERLYEVHDHLSLTRQALLFENVKLNK